MEGAQQYINLSLRGPPIDILGAGLEILPGHLYLFHKGDGKLYFFTKSLYHYIIQQ